MADASSTPAAGGGRGRGRGRGKGRGGRNGGKNLGSNKATNVGESGNGKDNGATTPSDKKSTGNSRRQRHFSARGGGAGRGNGGGGGGRGSTDASASATEKMPQACPQENGTNAAEEKVKSMNDQVRLVRIICNKHP